MLSPRLSLNSAGDTPLVLGLSAHPDDVEVGAGGTLLLLAAQHPGARFVSVVLTGGGGVRADEARSAFAALTGGRGQVRVLGLRDGHLPGQWSRAKDALREVADEVTLGTPPALVLAPSQSDAHQDHRLISELAWQLFRDTLVLEYEIPKWEGDLGPVNAHVALPEELVDTKLSVLREHFPSQAGRPWFDDELFRGVLRLRGVGCGSRFAEGFHARKLMLSI